MIINIVIVFNKLNTHNKKIKTFIFYCIQIEDKTHCNEFYLAGGGGGGLVVGGVVVVVVVTGISSVWVFPEIFKSESEGFSRKT